MDDLFIKYDYAVPYDVYEFFYQVSCAEYNLLFSYAEWATDSGNLSGAFLREAILDFELYSIPILFSIEKNNIYNQEDFVTPLSIRAYDSILETQKNIKNAIGYGLSDRQVSESYAAAAHDIAMNFGSSASNKVYEYYKAAVELLEASQADSFYSSEKYYAYYVARYLLLCQYQADIKAYGLKCDFDIDKEIYECMYQNYRIAQSCSRDQMIVQTKNLINQKNYVEAENIAKEIVDICEERVKNSPGYGNKLSLKNAYELLLSIPELSSNEQTAAREKLNDFLSTMKHEDFYCKDGDKEYPVRPS